ncbi:MAG: hypothetical protein AAFW70_29580 [Cyanobacteria bacterium J06635_10]
MIRRTMLVGLMSAFGMVASAGSALAQTVGNLGVTFQPEVGMLCEFRNTSGNQITSFEIPENTPTDLKSRSGEGFVKLICTTTQAQLSWTNFNADLDGQPLPDDTRAVLSAFATNLDPSPIRIGVRGTNPISADSSGIVDNSSKPINEDIRLVGVVRLTDEAETSGQQTLLAGTYTVQATLTATPQ